MVPTIQLPAPATIEGERATIYPSFDGHVRFVMDKNSPGPSNYLSAGVVVVFDDFPEQPVKLDNKRLCWIKA
jgi:hypothetical protein